MRCEEPVKILKILRLTEQGYSQREIAQSGKSTVGKIQKRCGIAGLNQELTPHSLRHTHTSLLTEADEGLDEIMERLEHADDETTRKVYLHVTKDMKKEAAHKLDLLMDNLKYFFANFGNNMVTCADYQLLNPLYIRV